MVEERYNIRKSEQNWQQQWREKQCFVTAITPNNPYYVLEMFPYPSGNIHMGHVRNYTLGDVIARLKRMQGHDVLYPIGWDSFGLPAENAAIERNRHPAEWTDENITAMREQLKRMGLSYDWSRELATCKPDYYKYEQEFFLDFLEKGLAYRKEAMVNWDPVDQSVLANEQVVDGKGWRSGAPVEQKMLSQWFLKITDYAEELLEDLDTLDGWPEKVRMMQRAWIGKSQGAEISFDLDNADNVVVFTTRPDTLFGAAFIAVAADHPLAQKIADNNAELSQFIKECQQSGTSETALEKQEKRGFKLDITAKNPFTEDPLPVYVANFVLMGYGTGAVFGCPAHDQRDYDFAKKYDLPIRQVVEGGSIKNEAYTGDGLIINSGFLDGLPVETAKKIAIDKLILQQQGASRTTWRLRDWLISRQRYWGCPIPVVHCSDCGVVPVNRQDLPITLPNDISFEKSGNPLDHHPTWKNTECPKCGKAAQRETDTFDTFFESSWYFLKFASPTMQAAEINQWLPVGQYIGGIEHAVLHLLYARFYTKALRDCGYHNIDEPFKNLMTQGMVCHATYQDAAGKWLFPHEAETQKHTVGRSIKMSKSKRNVVDPAYIIDTYGADTARLFMLSDSPPERDMEWTTAGVEGAWRYVNRLYRLVSTAKISTSDKDILKLAHRTIDDVTQALNSFAMNTAVAKLREFSNALEKAKTVSKETLEILLKLWSPFIPHVCEELWHLLGHQNLLTTEQWPVADQQYLTVDTVTLPVQVNGKRRGEITVAIDASNEHIKELALALPNVLSHLGGKPPRKVIVVPQRIVNIVA